MTKLFSLLRVDSFRLRHWFSKHSGIKALVILGFFLVIAVLVGIEYFLSHLFFLFAAGHGEFGKAVANYSLNAAFLVLFIFAVTSSIATSGKALYQAHHLKYLISTPLDRGILFTSRLLSTFTGSLFLFLVFLLPIIFAYGNNLSQGTDYLLRGFFCILILSLSAHSLGSLACVILVNKFGNLSSRLLVAIFILTALGAVLLTRFLFPQEFFNLYHAQDWPQFSQGMGKLPLFSTFLPTHWLADTLTNRWSALSLYALLAAIGISLLAYLIGSSWYYSSWEKSQEVGFSAGKKSVRLRTGGLSPHFRSPALTLAANELLSLLWKPSEIFYLSFLSGLMVLLLALISRLPRLNHLQPEYLPLFHALAFAGLAYLFMTLGARIIYPSMAKEKSAVWFLFSLPLTRQTFLLSKILYAVLVSLPALVVGVAAVVLAKIPLPQAVNFLTLFVLTVFVVNLVGLLFGIISPNFSEADNLDATSTSGSGLAAIVVSLIFILISTFAFYFVSLEAVAPLLIIGLVAGGGILLTLPLYLLARQSIYRYDL